MFMKFHSNGTALKSSRLFIFIFHYHHHLHVAGKKILTTLNCKETILSYLMSDNDAIKREAIACVSEMLTATI
jgi:hypothetical protein